MVDKREAIYYIVDIKIRDNTMKKIIILITIICSFGWCNCKLEEITTFDDNNKYFKFKCKTPFEYNEKQKIDSTIYFVETSYIVINTQQCNYLSNGDRHCINIETDDNINCDAKGSCKVNFVIDKFGIHIYEDITFLTLNQAKNETTKLWNNLKKYIPLKNNKIYFPITNM